MSSEIATWGMIHAKVSSFPVPVAGRENESLTRSEILSKGGVEVSGIYGNNECVMLDDIDYMPYPCVSATDKTPLGNTILTLPRVTEGFVYLSTYVDSIHFDAIYVATIAIPIDVDIAVNQIGGNPSYEITHRGNYMIIKAAEYVPAINTDFNITISGISYVLKFKFT